MDEDRFETPHASNAMNSFKGIATIAKENQDLIRTNFSNLNMPKIDMTKLGMSNFNMPKIPMPKLAMLDIPVIKSIDREINISGFKEFQEEMAIAKEEERKREIENNENLKSLAIYNQQLVDYNGQLVSLNEAILKKINNINNTIDKVGDDLQIIGELGGEQTKLLLDLIYIVESKDSNKNNKLGSFFKGMPGDLAVGLMIEYFKIKIGLS